MEHKKTAIETSSRWAIVRHKDANYLYNAADEKGRIRIIVKKTIFDIVPTFFTN
jgi:hypothetical protein